LGVPCFIGNDLIEECNYGVEALRLLPLLGFCIKESITSVLAGEGLYERTWIRCAKFGGRFSESRDGKCGLLFLGSGGREGGDGRAGCTKDTRDRFEQRFQPSQDMFCQRPFGFHRDLYIL
jgi:hypothetical protein